MSAKRVGKKQPAKRRKKRPYPEVGPYIFRLTTEAAANLAENLPDGAATGVAVRVTREEKHLADLLIRICLARTG